MKSAKRGEKKGAWLGEMLRVSAEVSLMRVRLETCEKTVVGQSA